MVTSLETLLSETQANATKRAADAFDSIVGSKPLVLRGAGGLGRMIARGLRGAGRPPVAFIDNNPALHGKTIEDIPVLSAAEATKQLGQKAAFVVTIWGAGSSHRQQHSIDELRSLGCETISTFVPLFWRYPEIFLPYYCIDLPQNLLGEADDIRAAFRMLSDDRSRDEFMRQLQWRLSADFNVLTSPGPEEQYFPPGIFRPAPAESYVDCGAFDGDTLRAFLRRYQGSFERYMALEPDPKSFAALQSYCADLAPEIRRKISCSALAASDSRGTLRFNDSGTAGASVSSDGAIVVQCAPLDEILYDVRPTIIKMDIEGAELSALTGGIRAIAENRPVLQICVYHRPNDLWRLPLFINSICPDYRFFLRPHNEEGWDLICYAIPPERASSTL